MTQGLWKRIEQRLRWKRRTGKQLIGELSALVDVTVASQVRDRQRQSSNPLSAHGASVFSQSDEDGITIEILRRIDRLDSGVYAEFGVGDGVENNTLVLAALGWRGFWVGGQDLAIKLPPPQTRRLHYTKAWINLDNIVELARAGLQGLGESRLDVISLDLDGNDLHFVHALLGAGVKPALFIVEYNARFPPPIEFSIDYDSDHRWNGDDYFGASLASFHKVFNSFRYRLVCCNGHTGSNAFFVDSTLADRFADVPTSLNELYVAPHYWLPRSGGHRKSLRTIERVLAGGPFNPKSRPSPE